MSEDLLAGKLPSIIGHQPGRLRRGQILGNQLPDRLWPGPQSTADSFAVVTERPGQLRSL